MKSNLFLRIVSALVLAPIVIGSIWYGKQIYYNYTIPLYTILLATLGVGLAWEWSQMFERKVSVNTLIIALFSTVCVFMTESNPIFSLWFAVLGTTIVFQKSSSKILYSLGMLYICVPLISLGYIYYVSDAISREIVLWLFFVVWATDIGGYVVGKTIGGPKLMPKISPKKTWAGLLGGVLFAVAVAYVFALYLKANNYLTASSGISFTQLKVVLLSSAAVLAVVSQMGDFFESYIKRKLDIKDSSNLIPGHGGLFDRVDGLLFAAVLTAMIVYFFRDGGVIL